MLIVMSVLKEDGKLPLLMARRVPTSMGPPTARFPETLFQQAFASKRNSYYGKVGKSPVDGKYRVTVDDRPVLEQEFESEAEARLFLRGFIVGFTSGTAETK
jgi:hypothetical protein